MRGDRETVVNIGPRERRKRVVRGAAMLLIASVIFTILEITDASRGWRFLLFVPLWIAALGFFQAWEHT